MNDNTTNKDVIQDWTDTEVPLGWIVRFRAGGERITMGGRHKSVKNFFQERGVVPWMRAHIPLLYRGERLVAVGDLWVAADSAASPGVALRWDGRPALH